ncbi:Fimbrial periplasmic chaperone SfmC [Salmonella enterica subsp. enterica serovar Wandsworth str. A4-580]|uniref:Fimbrial periplasmic chaperone SfmC n=1 Tax=Salmonella enterica subsp. enterica serovar Wandsworth str. A4-580 TaxID=913086 RepID=G5S5P6_SALET|nr:Fimbrial periplasmic chaperone SfmC [Salmonella enterica subsp. enterica serovar Wandsworth str. A4-580]
MLPRRRHLAWFIPDSLSGFFSRLLGGEKGALRASLRSDAHCLAAAARHCA